MRSPRTILAEAQRQGAELVALDRHRLALKGGDTQLRQAIGRHLAALLVALWGPDMTAADLLADLQRRGVTLAPAGPGRLLVDAPPGTLTDADRDAIRQHTAALLTAVCQQQPPAPERTTRPRPPPPARRADPPPQPRQPQQHRRPPARSCLDCAHHRPPNCAALGVRITRNRAHRCGTFEPATGTRSKA